MLLLTRKINLEAQWANTLLVWLQPIPVCTPHLFLLITPETSHAMNKVGKWAQKSLMKFKSRYKVLPLDGGNHEHTMGDNSLRAALWGRTWGFLWMKSWTCHSSMNLQPRRLTLSWAASKKAQPAG